MPAIRIYHSFRSPYSRLGLHIVARAGLHPELVPFTGPPEGVPFFDPVESPAKLAYYREDVPRMTSRLRLPFSMPNPVGTDFLPSYRAAIAAELAGSGLAFALAVSDARWGEGRDIADLNALTDCAVQAGLDRELVYSAQTDEKVGEVMRDHRRLIAEDQVFGVPFAVANGQKYWGHERFEIMVEKAALA